MKKQVLSVLFLFVSQICWAQFKLFSGTPVTITCDISEKQVVNTALDLFSRDCQAVFSAPLQRSKKGNIIIGTAGKSSLLERYIDDVAVLKGKKQAFLLKVLPDNRLLIVGSDKHGTAYGIMELSRLIGVSPWEWWADVIPKKRNSFELPLGYEMLQFPSVEYRGIFINDEDWGLMPWSGNTYEPTTVKGEIGPRTNARVFELLLRLRANTYWPAMHECTQPFFLTKGNREVAAKYGIYIGGSHCEPMACSTAGEWPKRGKGDYNYVSNKEAVYKFWEERVKEVAEQEILYTIGMRGIHDGQMQGAKTAEEQKTVLERVLKDQRALLRKYANKDIEAVPQVFIPYKEVLYAYNAGLKVPEDVTLMWCDDNYGYIRHFPDKVEQERKGGNGVYYHVSYWGRPHDYLWLGTFSPALLYQQMKLAYDRGIQKIWILNVGDIKPAEYQIELFMDMAWDMEQVKKGGITAHLDNFLRREFGDKIGSHLVPIMLEHYRLAYIRKPEFMGNTRVEEKSPVYKVVKDLPWSEMEINQRLIAYSNLSDMVDAIGRTIPTNRENAYFELVKYPVQAATQMNRKLLSAQLARHGKAEWAQSDAAYDSITVLTQQYNALEDGKWKGLMDFQPRKLPVFMRVAKTIAVDSMLVERLATYKWNAMEYTFGEPIPCEGLGYEGKAAAIRKGTALSFEFEDWQSDSIEVDIRLLPNHPIEDEKLRFALSVDGVEKIISYATQGRSEEWKMNVLRNQAIRKVTFPIRKNGKHLLSIKALDEGVVLDQIRLYSN